MTTSLEPEVDAVELGLLEDLLGERSIRTVFQPLVSLDSGQVLGYEALSRGPAGTSLESPDLLFAAARRARRLRDLDVLCRTSALEQARAGGLQAPYRLFINAEPEAVTGWRAPSGPPVPGAPPVFLELTERALARQPAQLLQTIAQVRSMGWGIALDDVGADPASLALLPLVQPDVIKLDLALVQRHPTARLAAIVSAVHAEAERSGTVVLAEGIETEHHLRTARAFGATVGQGWLFGHPGPLPRPLPGAGPDENVLRAVPRRSGTDDRSPFALAASTRAVRSGDKRLLIAISKQLEEQAGAAGAHAILLSAFQDASFFTPDTRRRYARLTQACEFVAAVGEGMPVDPLAGVRGAVIEQGDPLRGEWDIAVLAPHFSACLVARDLGDSGPDLDRRFEFVLSHDRELTTLVAGSLMARVSPEPQTTDLLSVPSTLDPVLSRRTAPDVGRPRPALQTRPRPPRAMASLPAEALERAISSSTSGITVADMTAPDTPLIWSNPAFEIVTGYRQDQVLGGNCRLLQGPGTDPRTIAEISAALRDRRQIRTRLLNYRRDGETWWNELQLSPVLDGAGALTHYIGVQQDVTARVEAEAHVLHLAYHDPLTGLPNRQRLHTDLTAALARGRRTGTATALLFIDLTDFKQVNDTYGHLAGDDLLRAAAHRLRLALRSDDLLVRFGGDEFTLLMTDLPPDGAEAIAERVCADLHAAMTPPFVVGGVPVPVGASIGMALAPHHADGAEQLLRIADAAMYRTKGQD